MKSFIFILHVFLMEAGLCSSVVLSVAPDQSQGEVESHDGTQPNA